MARNVTLSALRDAVRFQSDLIGATVRHTDAQLTTLINTSIQGFREEISNDGNTHYLVASSGTLSTGATSPFSFLSLDVSSISPSIVRTYGLDVTVDGIVHSLDHRPFTERNIWSGPATTGIPRHWAHYQTAKLAIQPAPNSAYAYTLWYLPVLADLGDGDSFNGVSGWEDWIVWDVVCRLLIRDQQAAAYGIAKTYRDDVWTRIKRQATRVSSAGGAVVGRDTLRGRIPDPLAARGPFMAGGGLPATHSIVLSMLSEQTGPVFLGRIVGTGDVQAMTPTEGASILPLFSPSGPGLVPAAGGSSTTKFLSQAGTFETPAGGGGGGSPGGPSGSIQFAGLSGFVGYTGFAVQGTPPSMTVRLPGSLRVTGGTVDVGSGTVRISASGADFGGGQLANVSSLFAFPTFAAGVPGLVPASDNDSSKFLNAAGGFATPPGGPGGPLGSLQFQNSIGAFAGVSGIQLAGSGAHSSEVEGSAGPGSALTFGDPLTAGGGIGTIRSDGPFSIFSTTPSGTAVRLFAFQPTGSVQFSVTMTGALVFGGVNTTNRLGAVLMNVGTGGKFTWRIASVSGTPMSLTPSGLDFYGNAAFKSLSIADGIPNAQLATVPSGTVKGSLSNATPSDLPIPTLAAFFPTFTSNRAGLVAPGDGDTGKFLNAAGAFATPPAGAGGSPSGPVFSLQFNNNGTFEGATGIRAGASGQALFFGPSGGLGALAAAGNMSVSPTGIEALGIYAPTGVGKFQAITVVSGIGNQFLDLIGSGMVKARLSGTGAPQDVPVATLLAFAPTFTSTRAGVVMPSDGQATSFLAGDHAWRSPSGGHQFPPVGGATNEQLAVVPSGTVKGRLSQGVPQDLLIPTLAAFFPTFTAARAGLVAPGDGDTGKFLNAAGAFATPVASATPGGDSGNVQWNNAGAMAGASAVHALVGGAALGIGPAALVADRGDLRVASGFMLAARNPSGIAQPMLEWFGASGMFRIGSSGLPRMLHEVASGGVQEFGFGGATATTARLTPTGLDASSFHIKAKSLDVGHINGLPFDFNGLKRGIDISSFTIGGTGAAIPSGLNLYLPRGAGSGANRYIIPSGIVGTGTQFVILNPTGGKGGGVVRIEKLSNSGSNFEVRTPTGTVLHAFPSGAKGWGDFMFEKPSGAAFQLAGHADIF